LNDLKLKTEKIRKEMFNLSNIELEKYKRQLPLFKKNKD
jgi:hypothetical protein